MPRDRAPGAARWAKTGILDLLAIRDGGIAALTMLFKAACAAALGV
jgi:hypothetical protein